MSPVERSLVERKLAQIAERLKVLEPYSRPVGKINFRDLLQERLQPLGGLRPNLRALGRLAFAGEIVRERLAVFED